MLRRCTLILLAGLLVGTVFSSVPSSAEAARSRRSGSGYKWGGGTSRYGFYPPHRTHGMKQLGPVPALGGVRSLKGWGGER